jgi:dihydrofolate reductase
MYNIIVACDNNRGIGKNNTIPWYFSEDLKYFSKVTKGNHNNAIIMGKNTWLSLTKPLLGRDNLILSTTLEIEKNNPKNNYVKTFKTLEELDLFCVNQNYTNVWVIGGGQIYNDFLNNNNNINKIDKVYATLINNNYDCDVFFPKLDESKWKIIKQDDKEENNINISYIIYENILTNKN